MMIRVSPAQLPPLEGVPKNDSPVDVVVLGGFSVLHPLLLANGEPYPPGWLVAIRVAVVAGIAGVVEVAGIAGVLVTEMLL